MNTHQKHYADIVTRALKAANLIISHSKSYGATAINKESESFCMDCAVTHAYNALDEVVMRNEAIVADPTDYYTTGYDIDLMASYKVVGIPTGSYLCDDCQEEIGDEDEC